MVRTVEIPVSEEAARVLANDPDRVRQVGFLVEQMLLHSRTRRADRLDELLERTSSVAQEDLTDEDIDAELASFKAGRHRRR